jgi:hypothetical protein
VSNLEIDTHALIEEAKADGWWMRPDGRGQNTCNCFYLCNHASFGWVLGISIFDKPINQEERETQAWRRLFELVDPSKLHLRAEIEKQWLDEV